MVQYYLIYSLLTFLSDPRVQGWFLFDTPIATFAMVVAYLAFVLVIGPLWMANRKPFRIKNVLVGYNAAQVLLSLYMFYEVSDDINLKYTIINRNNVLKKRDKFRLVKTVD